MPVQLILDASALTAYGSNVTVGELLGEIEAEDRSVAFSTGSLAQAVAGDADPSLLELLLQRDSCVAVAPMADWETFGRFLRLVGSGHDLHDAFLVMTAFEHRAYILTARPDRYTAIHKSVWCIELEPPWNDDSGQI